MTPENHLEHGYKRYWRPAAAYIYLFICLFDFVVAPVWVGYYNRNSDIKLLTEIREFESVEARTKALEQLKLGEHSWEPLTLVAGGTFHMAFGAILGVAAYARGKEKVAAIAKDKPS